MSRHAIAAETRRHLRAFPQFEAEATLPDHLRQLLAQLERTERRESR